MHKFSNSNCSNWHKNINVRLEENGVLTDCNIQTQESSEILDFNFLSTNVVNKIIMKVKCSTILFLLLEHYSDTITVIECQ